jgi:hypothetical protein
MWPKAPRFNLTVKGPPQMLTFELRYRRWQAGRIKSSKELMKVTIAAKTQPKAFALAAAEWDRLMQLPAHLHPEFIGLYKKTEWTPEKVSTTVT